MTPAPGAGPHAARARRTAMVEGVPVGVAVAAEIRDGRITAARITISGLAPAARRAQLTEAVLLGRAPSATVIAMAAQTTREDAPGATAAQAAALRDLCHDALTASLGGAGEE